MTQSKNKRLFVAEASVMAKKNGKYDLLIIHAPISKYTEKGVVEIDTDELYIWMEKRVYAVESENYPPLIQKEDLTEREVNALIAKDKKQ